MAHFKALLLNNFKPNYFWGSHISLRPNIFHTFRGTTWYQIWVLTRKETRSKLCQQRFNNIEGLYYVWNWTLDQGTKTMGVVIFRVITQFDRRTRGDVVIWWKRCWHNFHRRQFRGKLNEKTGKSRNSRRQSGGCVGAGQGVMVIIWLFCYLFLIQQVTRLRCKLASPKPFAPFQYIVFRQMSAWPSSWPNRDQTWYKISW